jgi:hypothetical protein
VQQPPAASSSAQRRNSRVTGRRGGAKTTGLNDSESLKRSGSRATPFGPNGGGKRHGPHFVEPTEESQNDDEEEDEFGDMDDL